jgi:hypothetical protein
VPPPPTSKQSDKCPLVLHTSLTKYYGWAGSLLIQSLELACGDQAGWTFLLSYFLTINTMVLLVNKRIHTQLRYGSNPLVRKHHYLINSYP